MKIIPLSASNVSSVSLLIQKFASKGMLLPRSEEQIYRNIQSYMVLLENKKVAGCVAVSPYTEKYAEMRSLVVDEEYHSKGFGKLLVEAAINRTKSLEIKSIFALTYVADFFEKNGFTRIDKKELPHKIWNDCLGCSKFPDCDEIALIKQV